MSLDGLINSSLTLTWRRGGAVGAVVSLRVAVAASTRAFFVDVPQMFKFTKCFGVVMGWLFALRSLGLEDSFGSGWIPGKLGGRKL